jgi:uncharacterized protein
MDTRLFKTKGVRTLLCVVAIAGWLPLSAAAQAPGAARDSGAGSVWWSELVSANPERSRDFYASVIGWTPKVVAAEDTSRPPAPGEDEYTVFLQNGTESAGLAKYDGTDPGAPRPGWLTYIQVKNVDEAVAQAISKGGKILSAPADVDGMGRVAVIQDPDGNSVGLVTPSPQASH